MTHNLKALGLALVAALTMGAAMAVPAAQAQLENAELTAEESPVTLDGTNQGFLVITRDGRSVHCTTADFHAEAETGDTTIEMLPVYAGCVSNINSPVTITTNGCGYRFHLKKDTINHGGGNLTSTYTAETQLICPPGQSVQIHVYASHANHTTGVNLCRYDFSPQTFGGTIDLTNEPANGPSGTPKDWITAHLDFENIVSTRTIGSALICGVEHDTAGQMHGVITLKGTNLDGDDNGITISTDGGV
jgi:hypothetical protein